MTDKLLYAKEISILLGATLHKLWKQLISALEGKYGKVKSVRYDSAVPIYEHVFKNGSNELCAVCACENHLSFKITLDEADKREFEMHRETFSEKAQQTYDDLHFFEGKNYAEINVDNANMLDSLVELVSIKKREKHGLNEKIKKVLSFFFNPHLLLCFGIAWMITNGWAYIAAIAGTVFHIKWMMAVGLGYLAFLWIPLSPEKIVTVAIAILLLRFIFPKDEKTLGTLREMSAQVKAKVKKKKNSDKAPADVKNKQL